MTAAIVDAGPLVAFFDRAERNHRWVAERFEEVDAPMLVCEPVISEAMFLLAGHRSAKDAILKLVDKGILRLAFRIEEHVAALRELMRKYDDVPMSLADACIVRMAEIHDRHVILTLDSDFWVYRKNGRTPLRVVHPGLP